MSGRVGNEYYVRLCSNVSNTTRIRLPHPPSYPSIQLQSNVRGRLTAANRPRVFVISPPISKHFDRRKREMRMTRVYVILFQFSRALTSFHKYNITRENLILYIYVYVRLFTNHLYIRENGLILFGSGAREGHASVVRTLIKKCPDAFPDC